jgi:hypothetical protein
LGVSVKLSTNPHKKLDVYHNKTKKKIASIGASGYADYPTFMKMCGVRCARRKRRSYKRRHEKDRHRRGTNGYYADKLLW